MRPLKPIYSFALLFAMIYMNQVSDNMLDSIDENKSWSTPEQDNSNFIINILKKLESDSQPLRYAFRD